MKKSEEERYEKWTEILENAVQGVIQEIQNIENITRMQQGRGTVEHYKWRIKTIQSIEEKLQRKHLKPSIEMAQKNLYDVAGIRVICPFVNDVYRIVQNLQELDSIVVVKEKDYILQPKESGYRSYHMIVKYPVEKQEKTFWTPVEIQLRTIAMDCWASLEHQLRYKKEFPESKTLKMELKRCANEMASTDLSMQVIQEFLDTH